jgi:Uma2 family endonuclease
MAIEILDRAPWRVSTYVPNERETQILGGNQAHASAGYNLAQTLLTHAKRLGVVWLVRFEADFYYPRVNGPTGVFYPDVFMAPDVEIDDQKPYDVSLVGRPPALVVEITSKKTVGKDVGLKLQAYAEMGVEEYVTFDPRPRKKLATHGYRLLSQGRYQEIPLAPEGGFWLTTVGLRIQAEAPTRPFRGPLLRLTTRDGNQLLHLYEEAEARDEAEWARDEAERERDEAERERDEAERTRQAERQTYETEIARLRALLEEAGRDPTTRNNA